MHAPSRRRALRAVGQVLNRRDRMEGAGLRSSAKGRRSSDSPRGREHDAPVVEIELQENLYSEWN